MNWKQEAKEVLEFHEKMQKEKGKSRDGRPDVITGRKGWGIRDTAKALEKSFGSTQVHIKRGLALRLDPNFSPRRVCGETSRSIRQDRLEDLLGTVRTTIFILKKDKRTLKIGSDLEKVLREYEQ